MTNFRNGTIGWNGHGGLGWGTTTTSLDAGATTATGGTGFDLVTMNSAGGTIAVSAVEMLLGGVGTDVVTLAAGGNTLAVYGVETLTGGVGTDVVSLGGLGGGRGFGFGGSGAGYGSTLSVSGIETLIGGAGADVITVTSGAVSVSVGGGDQLTLAAANGVDRVILQDDSYRPYGDSSGYAQITNFESGTDSLVLSGGLRRRLDDNRDGVVATASRTTGTIDLATDEAVELTTTVASLTDTDYASVRAAIGTLTNSASGADALVLANDGASTGVYLVVDVNGDGAVAANEIRLLGVMTGTTGVSATSLVYG